MFQLLVGGGIFISAFLLFFIQLLLAKQMLPQFGGSAFVWITSMLFFQTSLLVGYLYAYLLAKIPSLRTQAFIHSILLVASLYYIPIQLDAFVIESQQWPPLSVSVLLSSIILLPFIVISASSPLLQHWYCQVEKSDFPYYFYSISNAGSLLGLLGYPFLLEPLIGLHRQATLWTVMYLGYCVLCATFMASFSINKNSVKQNTSPKDVSLLKSCQWIFLSFLSSALLLSITQFLAQNIINLPLMWVAPLSLYLISFIVTFAKASGYDRNFWLCTFLIFLTLTLWLTYTESLVGYNVIIILFGLLYSACMICHGELILRKPSQNALTTFYLFISLGGVLGSLFVNIVAYVLLGKSWDFYIPLILMTGLVFIVSFQFIKEKKTNWEFSVLSSTCAVMIIILTSLNLFKPHSVVLAEKRSVYGLIRILEHGAPNNSFRFREMRNGQILHGMQYLSAQKELTPTSYYGKSSGVYLAFQYLHQHLDRPLNVAAIGLGCGTVAALGRKGDHIDFYEIDENVKDFSYQYFTFLKKSSANINVIIGDGRLSLIKAQFTPDFKRYDLIITDAFSGDAVPFHLLTREAMTLYRSILTEQGIIAIHTTNTYINFMPLTKSLAAEQNLQHFWIEKNRDKENVTLTSYWAILTSEPNFAKWINKQHGFTLKDSNQITTTDWTDDYNSVLPLLKFSGP